MWRFHGAPESTWASARPDARGRDMLQVRYRKTAKELRFRKCSDRRAGRLAASTFLDGFNQKCICRGNELPGSADHLWRIQSGRQGVRSKTDSPRTATLSISETPSAVKKSL